MLNRFVRYAAGLFGRYAWFGRLHHPSFMLRFVRPARTHWSGIQLHCWRRGEQAATLEICVWRLSPAGPKRLRSVTIPTGAIDSDELTPVYWTPIAHPPRLCVVTMRQIAAGGCRLASPPLMFSWKVSVTGAIHSPPTSESPAPGTLGFSPVTQCNLNCIHCISRHSRKHVAELSDEAFAHVQAAAAHGHLKLLRSDYSGDLLFADRRRGGWLERLEQLGIPLGMDTHANDLTADAAERLLRIPLRFINFSVDSMDPEDYSRIRRGARPLSEVIANIRGFMAARRTRQPDATTMISFVLMRRNLDSLHEAIDLAAELGIDIVAGSHMHAYTSEMAEESLMLEPERYARTYDRLLEHARGRQVSLVIPPPVRRRTTRRSHQPCRTPWESMVVLGNGELMACCVPGTTVGNLRTSSLEAIWNGENMQAFRTRVNSDNPPDPCRVCPIIRLPHNFASYVPGLPEHERQEFERRCLEAHASFDHRSGRLPS
jgi:radical SAM protein with 4Fe4S-binding SPASM domain